MQKKEERMDIAEVLARRRPQRIAKRAMDIILSAAALAVLWPLLLLIALAVVIDDPGPVFYRQVRIGRGGKPFRIFKFRSMVTAADKKGLAITVGRDNRITRVGAILRKTKLDELAQLLNVLCGQKSFVGPRPMSMADAAAVGEGAQERFSVRPGLVSSLEMYGGEALTYPDMFEEDAEYVAHRGFFHDIAFFMSAIANRIRGEKKRCGVCAEMGYVDWLYSEGEITQQDIEGYRREGEAKTKASRANAAARKEAESRDFKTFR